MDLSKFILVALIGEALWETSKLLWQQGKVNVDRIGIVLVGILLAIVTGLDLFEALGMPLWVPLLGKILTGLLLSRGANFMHDIIGSMNTIYTKSKSNSQ